MKADQKGDGVLPFVEQKSQTNEGIFPEEKCLSVEGFLAAIDNE